MTSARHLAVPVLLAAALLAGCTSADRPAASKSNPAPVPSRAPSTAPNTAATDPAFAALEHRYGARLGVYVLDTGTGRTVTYRADERFAFDSTYKALIAGLLLRTDSDADLAKVIHYTAADLQSYAPITSKHVDTGMSVSDLIAAAVQYSDNTAADLLLTQLGGPSGLQSKLRAIGDTTTNSNRTEPTVNTAIPGDSRDTSTPRAFGTDLRQFLLGTLLPGPRRQTLTALMLGNTTGGPYIRAGVPAGWKAADKTGNGDYGTRNDVAVVWPPNGAPVVIVIDSARSTKDASSADALLADATRTAVTALH